MECNIHRGKRVSLVCITCGNNPVVCDSCIVSDHNGHRFSEVDTAVDRGRKLLESLATENRQLISDLTSYVQQLESEEDLQAKACTEVVKQIATQQKVLHAIIDDIGDGLRKKSRDETQNNIKSLQDLKDAFNAQLTLAKKFDADIKNALHSDDVLEIIKASKNMKPFKDTCKEPVVPNKIQFREGSLDMPLFQAAFGGVINEPINAEFLSDILESLVIKEPSNLSSTANQGVPVDAQQENQDLSIISMFHYSTPIVSSLLPTKSGLCWVRALENKHMTLIDRYGTDTITIKFDFNAYGVGISPNMDMIYACGMRDQNIQKISIYGKNIKIERMFDTTPFYPCGIACTSSGELLVILNSSHSGSRITKYTSNGQIITHSHCSTFVSLGRIRINRSEDTVIVADNLESGISAYIVLLNPNLTVRMSYLGPGKVLYGEQTLEIVKNTAPNILVSDVCSDEQDRLLVCDVVTQSVQMLSPNCQYLKTVMVDTFVPRSIAVGIDNEIWVGYMNGKIQICKVI